jgi:hypothetical protein
MLFEKWRHAPDTQITGSARRRSGDKRYRLAGVEILLGVGAIRQHTDKRPK